ncbi:hypothetical protein MNBD_ALPHA01-1016 [hydrothermal vent metagenome]|uniref:ATP synthase protein I n=1 Tax=hydrothermal vent metagenome TaxID=652676 RepID=A0A3B0SZ19_9ZZZZ
MEQEPPLTSLGDRVKKAQKAIEPRNESGLNEHHAYGMAMRLVVEMVSGLIVGLLIGYFLDKALGTKPWLLIIFVFLGLGAGIFNVMRTAKQIEATAARTREEAEKADGKEGNNSG